VAEALKGKDGVDQIAPFGTTLHVVGSDPAKLEAALQDIRRMNGIGVERGQTSLEDVFIQFMSGSRDNMS
jgi:ABC-2 type transport system ATP-binding protein